MLDRLPPANATIEIVAPLARRVLAAVVAQGGPAWLVGGTVRDYLLGRANHDMDFVVPQGGIRLARAVANALGGSFFVLDSDRDVGRAVLKDASGQLLYVDVARFRGPDLLDDLRYRDFTVNAIAAPADSGGVLELFDPLAGRADLALRRLRAVGEGAFVDDPLRVLRGVRFVAELGFEIEAATLGWMQRDAPRLPAVAPERVRDELTRVMVAPGVWQHLRLMAALGLPAQVLPELAATVGVTQSPPHYLDVFDHTRAVLGHLEGLLALLWPDGPYRRPQPVEGDPVVVAGPQAWDDVQAVIGGFVAENLRAHLLEPVSATRTRRDWLFWAALAHDWGKPHTAGRGEDGRIHFIGHEDVGRRLAEARAQGLAFTTAEAQHLAHLVDVHMRPHHLAHDYPPSRRALYRFFRAAADATPDSILLGLADRLGTCAPDQDPEGGWRAQLDTAQMALEHYFRGQAGDGAAVTAQPVPLLDGREIMAALQLPPGPLIGRLIEALREAQVVGEVASAEGAVAWLADYLAKEKEGR